MCIRYFISLCFIIIKCIDLLFLFFFFQAEDGIRDAQESRGLGDVYKRQVRDRAGSGLHLDLALNRELQRAEVERPGRGAQGAVSYTHLTLPTISSV